MWFLDLLVLLARVQILDLHLVAVWPRMGVSYTVPSPRVLTGNVGVDLAASLGDENEVVVGEGSGFQLG